MGSGETGGHGVSSWVETAMSIHPDMESLLLTREQIARRVAELGRQISEDYRGRDLVLVGALKGAIVFLSDLIRAISIPHRFDLIGASSYGSGTTSSGHVTISHRIKLPVAGCDILVVEDILDTGRTTAALFRELEGCGARDMALCVLLAKCKTRVVDIQPRYVGFEIPDRFVVGYGLD